MKSSCQVFYIPIGKCITTQKQKTLPIFYTLPFGCKYVLFILLNILANFRKQTFFQIHTIVIFLIDIFTVNGLFLKPILVLVIFFSFVQIELNLVHFNPLTESKPKSRCEPIHLTAKTVFKTFDFDLYIFVSVQSMNTEHNFYNQHFKQKITSIFPLLFFILILYVTAVSLLLNE